MSRPAGPMVPARTGRWALRPLALSVSSKVLPGLSFIAAGAGPCSRGAEDGARRWIKRDLHGPRAESRRGSSLLAGKERNAVACRTCAAAHAVRQWRWRTILDLRLHGAACLEARRYLTPAVLAYLRRNLSTRPAVSTIFCLPV